MPPEDPTKDRTERRDGEVIAMHPAESGMQVGRALLHALHNAGISVLYQDRQMKTVWARNMGAPWASETADGKDQLSPTQAERIS
ncbi:MAG: histidine kinase, partial [Mesorhizobium sp.]